MNLKGCLNYLKSSTNHIAKAVIIFLFITAAANAQQKAGENTSNRNDSVYVMKKSPWGAVLRSAILPGWGQIYNHSYLTVPVIWGIGAWLIYNWDQSNKLYKAYGDLYTSTNDYRYWQLKNDYHDQRDLFAIYIGLTYFLNLVDAYVDAELFDFSVQENTYTKTPMLNLKVNF